MNKLILNELELLLSDVLKHEAIHLGQNRKMSLKEFKALLQKCRSVYAPNDRHLISLYSPNTSWSEAKVNLLRLIEQELADFIRDGLIHSATIAISGGLTGGSPVEDILRNLLIRAIIDGPKLAAKAFADCATRSSCRFYQFFLVTEARIPESVKLFDGVSLIPLPESVSQLPPHLPFIRAKPDRFRDIGVNDLLGKTLVRVEFEASPIFHRPEVTYTLQSGPHEHFNISLIGKDLPDPNLNTICQALSVAGRCNSKSVLTWTSLMDYEIFDLTSFPGVGANGYSSENAHLIFDKPAQISPRQLATIKTIYRGLSEVPTRTWEKLRIPIDRWAKSMGEGDPIDKIIDLGIALESLYVPDSQGETSFRFALHAAWHLGKDKPHRQELRKFLRQVYSARSDVVHTGKLRSERAKDSFDLNETVKRAQELCWQGITAVIDAGEIPDWSNLILGMDLE